MLFQAKTRGKTVRAAATIGDNRLDRRSRQQVVDSLASGGGQCLPGVVATSLSIKASITPEAMNTRWIAIIQNS